MAFNVPADKHSNSGSCTRNSCTNESGILNSWHRDRYLQDKHEHNQSLWSSTKSIKGSWTADTLHNNASVLQCTDTHTHTYCCTDNLSTTHVLHNVECLTAAHLCCMVDTDLRNNCGHRDISCRTSCLDMPRAPGSSSSLSATLAGLWHSRSGLSCKISAGFRPLLDRTLAS